MIWWTKTVNHLPAEYLPELRLLARGGTLTTSALVLPRPNERPQFLYPRSVPDTMWEAMISGMPHMMKEENVKRIGSSELSWQRGGDDAVADANDLGLGPRE